MAARACLFLLIVFLAKPMTPEEPRVFVVWNVGQGLWSTLVDDNSCWHFDMGGEHAPWTKIMRRCRGRENHAHFSHWDSDHISFAGRARNFLPNICRFELPAFPRSEQKKRMLESLEACEGPVPFQEWRPQTQAASNDLSAVVAWLGVLIPGDSSKSAEKKWIPRLAPLEQISILVLGHHGSRTSTSRELLSHMPHLRMAVASARFKRYGHPHAEVVQLLRDYRVPLLSTEDWGNVVIYF